MPSSPVLSSKKLQNLLERIENDNKLCRKRLILESRHARYPVEAGTTFRCEQGDVTVLCIVDPEIWYFQGGLIYSVSKADFIDLVRRLVKSGVKGIPDSCHLTLLTRMEVELLLGIVSAVGPFECWMVVGSDLLKYLGRNREKLDDWVLRVTALLLARMVLKRYARRLYEKISLSLADGVWSNLSEVIATDDAFIARFTGRLLGTYRSETIMQRAMEVRWAIFGCVLEGLESLGNNGSTAESIWDKGMEHRSREFAKSMTRLGVNISAGEIRSLLPAMLQHQYEIRNALHILRAASEGHRRPGTTSTDVRL